MVLKETAFRQLFSATAPEINSRVGLIHRSPNRKLAFTDLQPDAAGQGLQTEEIRAVRLGPRPHAGPLGPGVSEAGGRTSTLLPPAASQWKLHVQAVFRLPPWPPVSGQTHPRRQRRLHLGPGAVRPLNRAAPGTPIRPLIKHYGSIAVSGRLPPPLPARRSALITRSSPCSRRG
ncbi:hypothetical protein SKAU_G00343200 [Synaphobranchus kaupii]|uniref:Uncharacterized protein n=1 Tax=Synaphobranchus kaupii TaxID=118154 RepID=A0A9Q1EJ00_SYNKA|nr:hypothetical protein SKAU_G00343200 [Synaphobranchus kaupii]